MKKKFDIIESRLYSRVNYSQILHSHKILDINLSYYTLDPIEITSGLVCIFDAYNYSSCKPFLQKVPHNCTPYYLAVLTTLGSRIAYAGLKFSDETIVKWKLALYQETDVLKLIKKGNNVTTIIDSGIMCFGDYKALGEYDKEVRNSNQDFHPMDRAVSFDGNTALNYKINDSAAFSVFSSGWGDGSYACYFGIDESGGIANIICDFNTVEYPEVKEDKDKVIPFTFDVNIEQIYQNDPKLSFDENNIAKWTFVLAEDDQIDNLIKYKAYSSRGNTYHILGKYNLALLDYNNALKIYALCDFNNNFKANVWTLYDNAGKINLALGNIEEAKHLFEKAKDAGDNFYAGAFTNLIDIYIREKNYEKAREIAGEMLKKRPNDPQAYIKNAEICVASENYEDAVKFYDILIDTFQWEEAILEKTTCLAFLGKASEALLILDNYFKENKANDFYYYNKGFLEYKQKNYISSYQDLIKAFEFNPEYLPTLHLLIELDSLLLNNNILIKWATKYIELRPLSEFGYNIRAEAYLQTHNYELAENDYEHIISKISRDSIYYRGLCLSYVKNRNFAKAQKILKSLKHLNFAAYKHNCAIIFAARKKYQKAKRDYFESFELVKNEEIYIDTIDFLIYTSDFTKAEELIKSFELFSPKNEKLMILKIKLALNEGKTALVLDSLANEYIDKFLPGLEISEARDKLKENIKKEIKS